MLMTCVNGKFKGYWYEEGYLRTTSIEYSTKNCKDLYTHLTNDAIQKYSPDYGKFERGNKVSYADFQKYLNVTYRNKPDLPAAILHKYNFYNNVLPQMKNLATDAMRATYTILSP
jgi:tubulin monoglycylase TTLL3/8